MYKWQRINTTQTLLSNDLFISGVASRLKRRCSDSSSHTRARAVMAPAAAAAAAAAASAMLQRVRCCVLRHVARRLGAVEVAMRSESNDLVREGIGATFARHSRF